MISHASSLEIDFKCQYKTDYVAGGADVITLPDVIDDSLTANGKWVFSLETVNPTKELSKDLKPFDNLKWPLLGLSIYNAFKSGKEWLWSPKK